MKEVLLNDGNLADIARLRSRWVMMEASKIMEARNVTRSFAVISAWRAWRLLDALSRRNGIEYGHDFLGGVEEACLGVLLLASCPLAGTAPVLTFKLILFHSSGIICIFAGEKAEVGEVPLPVWCQIQISNLILTFQTLSEIATLIRLQSFRFFLLFSRFSDASVCLSLTIQRYEITALQYHHR